MTDLNRKERLSQFKGRRGRHEVVSDTDVCSVVVDPSPVVLRSSSRKQSPEPVPMLSEYAAPVVSARTRRRG